MNNIKIILTLVLTAFVLSSCSTTSRVSFRGDDLNQFVGMSYERCVSVLGAPSGKVPGKNGGYTMVFEGCRDILRYPDSYVSDSGKVPQLQLSFNRNDVCMRVLPYNAEPVRTFSVWKTGGMILLLAGVVAFL